MKTSDTPSQKIYIGQTDSTPLGQIWIAISERGLIAISIAENQQTFTDRVVAKFGVEPASDEGQTKFATRQIQEYLAGSRQHFDLLIDWSVMSPFQEKVLHATYEIPRGETRTYGEIAAIVGRPRAAQAVGRAQATNPIPIVIPCHRVLAADGSLHGYSAHGGLDTKAWLLQLEGALFV